MSNRNGPNGDVTVYDTSNGSLVSTFRFHAEPPVFDFGPNGTVYSIARKPILIEWELETGKELRQMPMPDGPDNYEGLEVGSNGKYALLRQRNVPPRVIDLTAGKLLSDYDNFPSYQTLLDSKGEHIYTTIDPEKKTYEVRPLPGTPGEVKTITWDRNFVGWFDDWSSDSSRFSTRIWYQGNSEIMFEVADLEQKTIDAVCKRVPTASNPCFKFYNGGANGVLYLGKTDAEPEHRLLAFSATNWEKPIGETTVPLEISDIAVSATGDRVIAHGRQGNLISYVLAKSSTTVASMPMPPTTNPAMIDPNSADSRLPIPSDAKLKEAVNFLHERYKSNYDNRTRNVRFDLTQTLLKEADRIQDDPAMRYALYTEAESVGAALREPGVVLEAVRGLGQRFQIDKSHYLSEALQKMVNGGTKLTLSAIITAAALEAETAIEAHDYKGARELYDTAQAAAKRGNMPKEYSQAGSRLKALDGTKQRYEAFLKAEQTLKTQPNSAEANLAMGEYLCFNLHDWDAGLKALAQGSNDLLRKLADGEKNVNNDSLALGVAWNDAAKSVAEDVRPFYERRARYWLSQAAEGKVGITRDRIAEKLRFREGKTNYEPGLDISWQFRDNIGKATRGKSITANIDYTGDFFVQNQTVAAGTFAKVDVVWTGVIIPPHPGRFKIQVDSDSDTAVKWDGNLVYTFTRAMIGSATPPDPNLEQVLFDEPIEVTIRWEGYASPAYHLRLLLVTDDGFPKPIPPEWFYHEVK